MRYRHFVRSNVLDGIHYSGIAKHGSEIMNLNIPQSAFKDPMTLIPIKEVNQWLSLLEEKTGDADYMIKLAAPIDINRRGVASRWFFSGHDLAATIRRINVAISCFQSGAFLSGAVSGPYMKWIYENPTVAPEAKIHDGIRMVVFMTKVLRRYLGAQFCPSLIRLSGHRRNEALYADFFGCDIHWNQPTTEILFRSDLRMATALVGSHTKKRLAMSFSELDDLLGMPEPQDELKIVYEAINYARHSGLPKVEAVADLLGVSVQKFQRKLREQNVDFTMISSYVFSNVAVNLFSHGLSIEEVSNKLGYTNTASFVRMFKKNRGVTPTQYLSMFHEQL